MNPFVHTGMFDDVISLINTCRPRGMTFISLTFKTTKFPSSAAFNEMINVSIIFIYDDFMNHNILAIRVGNYTKWMCIIIN